MIGNESGWIAAAIGAQLFGILFAALVYGPLRGKHGGYTSLLVVAGVAGTLIFVGLLAGWVAALISAGTFVLTGWPMIAGEAVVTKVEEYRENLATAVELERMLKDDDAAEDAE